MASNTGLIHEDCVIGLRELSLVGLGVRESLYEWCFSWIRFGRNGDP